MRMQNWKYLVVVTLLLLAGCGKENPLRPSIEPATTNPSIQKPGANTAAARTTGYQAYKTDWQWDWKGPHFTIVFRIPHSTYSITRSAGIPTSCCEGGLNNWISSRRNLGNGWDDYTLLISKTLRSQYFYLTDWEFSRYFWLWCTYT